MVDYEEYSNISRPIEDLINKGLGFYALGSFKLTSELRKGLAYKGKINMDLDKAGSGSFKLNFRSDQFLLSQKFSSNNHFGAKLNYAPSTFPQFRLKSDLSFIKSNLKAGLLIKHESSSIKTSFGLTENLDFHSSLGLYLQNKRSLGLLASFSPVPFKLLSLKSVFSYSKDDFLLVFKDFITESFQATLSQFRFLGLYNWTDRTKLTWVLGGLDKENGISEIKLGLKLEPTSNTLVKLVFDQDANVSLSIKTQLTPYLCMSTSTRHNLFDSNLQKLSLFFILDPNT